MSTSRSSPRQLQAQARTMVAALKAMKPTDHGGREDIKFGIAMDDKIIVVTMPRETIRTWSAEALEEYILRLMRGEVTQ